ncbi:unnamed protein product [Absidia cylindrospora]
MSSFQQKQQTYSSYSYTSLPSPPPTYPSQLPNIITATNPSSHYMALVSSPEQQRDKNDVIYLPSIHNIALSPPSPSNNSDSPESFSDSTFSSPPSSTSPSFSSSSVPPSDIHSPLDISESCHLPPYRTPSPPIDHQQQRKGSIASLLNSGSELKQLDEEEHKCGYQSHFVNAGVKRSHPDYQQQQKQPPILDQAPKRLKPCNKQQQKQRYGSSSPYSTTTSTSPSSSLVLNERATKGLRHFSKQVCDKVKEHGVTTYDQVVHELTADLSSSSSFCQFDQKNIRRRVYDALNVLMAMNIIAKDKKEIKWLGIPSCYQYYSNTDTVADQEHNNNSHDLTDGLSTDDDYHLSQQIRAEEARNKNLLSSMSSTRYAVRDSLTMYLQLRRLIYRNQHELSPTPLTALPFMIMSPSNGSDQPILALSEDQKQAIISFTDFKYSMQQDQQEPSSTCPTFKDVDVLNHLFQHRFSSTELSSWLPDSTWHQYLDVASS